MKNSLSDLLSKLEFGHHYQLNSFPTSALTKKKENSRLPTDKLSYTPEQGIMFALGFIATLLLLSGMQLYRSVNLNLFPTKTVKFGQISSFGIKKSNKNNFKAEIQLKEIGSFTNLRKTEMSIIQNSVFLGKF